MRQLNPATFTSDPSISNQPLVATSTRPPTSTTRPNPTPVPTRTLFSLVTPTLTPIPIPPDVNPLTGLKVGDPAILQRRPIMVKVANFPREGRPHAGLSFADIVFEYYIGEFTNRFAALFLSNDVSKVGPIRSGRLVDAQLGQLYQNILVYGNADARVDEALINALGDRALASKNVPCPYVCYDGAQTVNNLFTDTTKLKSYIANQKISNTHGSLAFAKFDPNLPASNAFGIQINVEYAWFNRGEWRYDPDTRLYKRWIESVDDNNKVTMIPLTDRLTGQQLSFANVIIVFATYDEYSPTLHDIELLSNTSGKRAVVFRDALMIDGVWKTTAPDKPLQFFTSDGNLLPLKPGNTWIVLAGDASTFEQTSDGIWNMKFKLP